MFFFLFYPFYGQRKKNQKFIKYFPLSCSHPTREGHHSCSSLSLSLAMVEAFPSVRLGIGWWRSLPRRLVRTGYSNLHEHPEGVPVVLVSIGVLESPRRQTTIVNFDLLLLLNTGRCWEVLSRGAPIRSGFAAGVVVGTVRIIVIPVKREMPHLIH